MPVREIPETLGRDRKKIRDLVQHLEPRGASFTNPWEVRFAIDRFIVAHNEKAAPFEWTKSVVRQKGLDDSYSNSRN